MYEKVHSPFSLISAIIVPRSLYMLKQIKTDPKANVPLFHIWQSNHPRIGAHIRHILQAQCIVCEILVMKTTEILFS
jgi:hypothetical protein